MDQSPNRIIGRQKTATVIFNSECPKVVDRFRITRQSLTQVLPITRQSLTQALPFPFLKLSGLLYSIHQDTAVKSCLLYRFKGIISHHGKETHYIIYSWRTISGGGATSRRAYNGVVGDRACGCDPVSGTEAK